MRRLLLPLAFMFIAGPALAEVRVKNCDKVARTFSIERAARTVDITLQPGESYMSNAQPVYLQMAGNQGGVIWARNREMYCIWDGKLRLQRVWRNTLSH